MEKVNTDTEVVSVTIKAENIVAPELVELTNQVAMILGTSTVDTETPLGQIGVDSLNVVELILVCQQVYPNVIDVSAIDFDEHTTLREIHDILIENSIEM